MFKLGETIQFEDQANDVLTVGELLVDMISNEYGEDTVGDGYTRYFGGSPSNIAINAGSWASGRMWLRRWAGIAWATI